MQAQQVTPTQLMTLILGNRMPIKGITVHCEGQDFTTLPPTAAAHGEHRCDTPVGPVTPSEPDLPARLDVIRFYRPRNHEGKVVNDLGLTVLYELDYERRHIIAFFAICDGDNFDRNVGRQLVKERQKARMGIKLPLALERGPDLVSQLYNSIQVMESNPEFSWIRRILNTSFVNNDRAKVVAHVSSVRRFLLSHITTGV